MGATILKVRLNRESKNGAALLGSVRRSGCVNKTFIAAAQWFEPLEPSFALSRLRILVVFTNGELYAVRNSPNEMEDTPYSLCWLLQG